MQSSTSLWAGLHYHPSCNKSYDLASRQTFHAQSFSKTCGRSPGRSHGSFTKQKSLSSRKKHVLCRAEYKPFPFDEKNYHKCVLQVLSEERMTGFGSIAVGTLIFMREADMQNHPGSSSQNQADVFGSKVLAMGIGGESLQCLRSQIEGKPSSRPLSLELLWTILQRGQDISKKDWRLMHVAVVSMDDRSYIGRLFFGDSETKSIVWDCDCRPSDACWLALKTKCDVFMHKNVWDTCSQPWRELLGGPDTETTQKGATTVRYSDPEPVKRLKREMEVALSEEDYTTAARIRDHPYMLLVRQIEEHEQAGRRESALALRDQLNHLIDASGSVASPAEDTGKE